MYCLRLHTLASARSPACSALFLPSHARAQEAERAEAHEDDDEDDDDYAPAKLLARPGKTGPRKAPIMPAIDSDEDEEEEDEPVVKRPAGKTGPRKLAPPVDDDEEEEDGDDYEPNVLGRPAQPVRASLGTLATRQERRC